MTGGHPAFVTRHGLPGAIGTALVAIGALGIGWLPPSSDMLANPLVNVLRSSLSGSLAARGMVIIGLAVLLQAWLVLGTEIVGRGADRPRRGEMLTILGVWCVPLLLAPPMFSRDVYSYYVQGRVYSEGFDPTTTGVSVIPGWFDDGADPMWVESPTPYGPLFLLIERFSAALAHPNGYLAALLLRASAVLGVALIAWFLPRIAARHGIDPGQAMWLGVLNPVLLMHFVSGAHNDALMVGLVVCGLALATERACLWGAVSVSLAAAVKPIALLVLPFVGLLWAGREGTWGDRIRSWLYAALAAALTLTAVFLLAGVGGGVLSAAFGTPTGVFTWLSVPTALGQWLGMLTSAIGLTADASVPLAVVRAVGFVLAGAIIAYLVLRPGGRSPVRGAAFALLAVVVLGPVVQPWYLLWSLPLIAATGVTLLELRITVALTALFTAHGMIESSTNADNVTTAADTIIYVVAVVVVAIVVLAGRRERALVFGPADQPAIEPATDSERRQAETMRWPTRELVSA